MIYGFCILALIFFSVASRFFAWTGFFNVPYTEIPEFFKTFIEKSYFEVTDVKDDGSGHYTITASVSSPDIKDALIDYQKNFDVNETKEDIDKKITEIINNAEMKTTEQTATVIITDDTKEITFSDDFIDAMYGYAYNYAKTETDKALSLE